MMLRALGLAAALVLVAATAEAQAPASGDMQSARAALQQACSDDMKNLCDGKKGREMFQCLRENNDKVSQSCKDAMAKMPRRPSAPPAD